MDESTPAQQSLADYLNILRRRRWQFLIPAILILAAVAVIAVRLPAVYQSSATILIEQPDIPEDLVRTTVTSYADQRIQTISQRVMTIPKLSKIIEQQGLYAAARENSTMAALVERMRKDIHMEMVSAEVVDPRSGRSKDATIAFKLGFNSAAPDIAQNVANEVVSLFLDENLKDRQAVAKEASEFLAEEADKLGEQVAKLEVKLAAFKEKHGGALPEMQPINLRSLERLEEELRENTRRQRALDERLIYLQSELSQIDPYGDRYTATGKRIMSPTDRLKEMETEYVVIASRYSENHPDRVKMERELAALRSTLGGTDDGDLRRKLADLQSELIVLEDRYLPDHPDIQRKRREIASAEKRLAAARSAPAPVVINDRGDNPAYVQMSAQVKAAQAERNSLKAGRTELLAEIDEVEALLAGGPKIESEYLRLKREYENAAQELANVKNKEMTANLAESLESESKAERFVLIEPPLLPEGPISPNRLAILFLGFAASLVGGVGNVALREAMDSSVRGSAGVLATTGVSPIATIPFIATEADLAGRRLRVWMGALAVVGVIAAAVVAVHHMYMPVDVVYYQLLQKLNLI